MEIQHIDKDVLKNHSQKLINLSKNLRQVKILFLRLKKQKHNSADSFKQNIQQLYKSISNNLEINQRKVLKAYISYHLQYLQQQVNAKSNNLFEILQRNLLKTPETNNHKHAPNEKALKIQNKPNRKSNQNRLFQAFINWFNSNTHLRVNSSIQKQCLKKYNKNNQQLLINLAQQAMFKKISSTKNISNESKYCQATLCLLIIAKLNHAIFSLLTRQFSVANSTLSKAYDVFRILQSIVALKDKDIQKKRKIIEELEIKEKQQLKEFYLRCRRQSLLIKANQKHKNTIQQQKVDNQLVQEQKIKDKFAKQIDLEIQRRKRIIQQKIKLQLWLRNFIQRLDKVKNCINFQTDSEFNNQKDLKINIFNYEKLNRVLQKYLLTANNSKQIYPHHEVLRILFSSEMETQKSLFLSVDRYKKNMDLNLKDYFNLCLLLKKSKHTHEAILYFQILLYQYKKKEFIQQYCLKSYINQKWKLQQMMMAQALDDFQVLNIQVWQKMYQRFIKNQQLLKIYLFSLSNLVELYAQKGSKHWSLQTLKFMQNFIQENILKYLQQILHNLQQNKCPISNQLQEQNAIQHEQIENNSIYQKQCDNSIRKYSQIVQEIKFKIIKQSFNNYVIKSLKAKDKYQTFQTSKLLSTHQKSSNPISSFRSSTRVKKIQQKQNQLHYLVSNEISSENQIRQYFSCTQTPKNAEKMNLRQNGYPIPVKNSLFIDSLVKNQKHSKGFIYKNNSVNIKKKGIPFIQFSKNQKDKQQNKQFLLKQTNEKSKTTFTIYKNQNFSNSQIKHTDKLMKNSLKNEVKFSLVPQDSHQTSLLQIATNKSITQAHIKTNKNQTLNFLETAKSINLSSKLTRMGQFRQKLLQNRQQLLQYIRLTFQKLNTMIKNPYFSTISLNQIKTQNLDISLKVDQLFSDFTQLLTSLKTFSSFSQESFQRQLLIESKIKMVQKVHTKIKVERLLQIYHEILLDLNLLKNAQKKIILKKKILLKLASEYFNRNLTKKAIQTYLQISRLGDSIGYLKMGQIYMINGDYNNAVKYFEKYAIQKNFDLCSKIKLAHAYSKIPQYHMKTVDMLMGILIQNGSYSKFKQQIFQRKYDDKLVESAVILLSSLYFRTQNIQKAIDICQNYCKINIKNYRVLHILGGYYRYKNNRKKSFQCYINALQNNPSHHKSLIELTQFVCQDFEYKSHAVELLKKCFRLQSRSIQLLRTLIKFLGQKQTQPVIVNNLQKNKIQYTTLIKYAQILKQSKSRGYSTQNFYEQASIVYEWALNILQKNVCIGNLDQVQKIYKNLAQISLNQGDFIKSQTYYKLYLIQIEKYVNRSNLNEGLKVQKITKTKMSIYHLLGKVKKQQHKYKKAIQYFQKSFDVQMKFKQKLSQNLQSQMHLFEVAYCYFCLQDYQQAFYKFTTHKAYLLNFISQYDKYFFSSQRDYEVGIPQFLDLNNGKQRTKKNIIMQQIIASHNQNEQKNDDQMQNEQTQVEFTLKKNYFETQIHIAFCLDKQGNFIESKQIYKKIIEYLQSAQFQLQQNQKIQKSGKKTSESKTQQQRKRLLTYRKMTNNEYKLNQQYKQLKKICLTNLSNIYKLEGVQNKYKQTMKKYIELCPQNLIQKNTLVQLYWRDSSFSSQILNQGSTNRELKQNRDVKHNYSLKFQSSNCFTTESKFSSSKQFKLGHNLLLSEDIPILKSKINETHAKQMFSDRQSICCHNNVQGEQITSVDYIRESF